MAESAQVLKISHLHDQLMDFMIARPTAKLRDVAEHFQRTQAWVSTIIHSDVFQAKLRERQDQVFGEIALTVRDRIVGLANSSLELLAERVEAGKIKNGDLVRTTDSMLSKMGFGGPANAGADSGRTELISMSEGQLVALVSEARKALPPIEHVPRPWNSSLRAPALIEHGPGSLPGADSSTTSADSIYAEPNRRNDGEEETPGPQTEQADGNERREA